MEEEPPVTSETPETPENPETLTPEENDSTTEESPASPEDPETPTSETSHATRNTVIIVVAIVVVIAVVLALFFGLRGCNNDEPDEVNPDPEIVEPGPVEDPDDGDDGEEEDLIPSSMIVTGDDDLVVYYNNDADSRAPETLDLRDTLTVTVLDQFGNEYTGPYGGSEYRLSTKSSEYITLSAEGVVTGVSKGTATVTVTSVANTSLTEDIEIEVTKFYEVESISASIDSISSSNILLDWGATSGELQVTFTPTDATVQTYEVTPNDDTGLFTYDETTNTFTHTKLNTGTETFTITATDQSNNASTTITLECDPVIDEPYEVVWRNDEEHSLPETIAKGESITDLDNYVDVHFDHTGQDEHEYEDDTYTLSYAGSEGVEISGTNVTFTGNGGTQVYITVTATPTHEASPVYAVSHYITITQAVTELSLNYTDYKLKSCYSVTLEATFSPDDYYPKDQVTDISWAISGDDYGYGVTINPDSDDDTKCEVISTQKLGNSIDRLNLTITASVGELSSTCNLMVSNFVFAYDSWEEINYISSLGIAGDVYEVGDTKTITRSDSDTEYHVRIIDFNHDNLSSGDENYNNSSYNGGSNLAGITCECVEAGFSGYLYMKSGSVPSSGYFGWSYTSCYARSYLRETFFPLLDSTLQSVIKNVSKSSLLAYKAVTTGNTTYSINTTSENLFLLAKVELDGIQSTNYKEEGTQYAYYSEHNNDSDRIKYTRNGTAAAWWTRSCYNISYFYNVTDEGALSRSTITLVRYYVFAFCI